ncbi:DNA-binding protein [Paraburkholderia sediminicola]|uniref:DNA-binding protein n=1 Tax=Paraburkholderia sediminicola TaxID=458836 RepID=UPI0038B77C23
MTSLAKATPPALAAIAGARDVLTTVEAAPVINRRPQTLYKWACLENGPIRPVRINGRLAWRVADLAALLNGDR